MMRRMILARPLAVLILAALSATAAFGQTAPKAPKGDESWIAVLMAIVLLICLGIASFMSSKRGHQD